MLKAAVVFAVSITMLLTGAIAAPAVPIFSADGGGDGFGTLTCTSPAVCAPVAITAPPIPPWQNPATTSQPQAEWISYSAAHGTTGPANNSTASFHYSFVAPVGSSSLLNLIIWADDTATVVLDGVTTLFTAGTAANLGDACVVGAGLIGCKPGQGGVISGLVLAAGAHSLDFTISQLGGSGTPFGLLYAGDLTPTPEPATILLLGSALAAAGAVSRRRFRKVAN